MTTTHRDIEITYDEKDNRWHFELRGRQRSADSLAKAREFIDKPVTEKEEKPFKPISAWFWDYRDEPHKVIVTSIAEHRGYGYAQAWIKDGKDRGKADARHLFPDTDATAAVITKWTSIRLQRDVLSEQLSKLKASLKHIAIE